MFNRTNALILFACVALFALTGMLGDAAPALLGTLGVVQAMCVIGVQINALLIAFNLLPIPPLDGSHVFKYLLPRPLAVQYVRFGRYGIFVLIALLAWGERILTAWMNPFFAVADQLLSLAQPHLLATTAQWVL